MKTPTLRIDDSPLPARKCICLCADGGRFCDIKQDATRVKYYGLKQFKEHEPERVSTVEAIVHACNNHDALLEALKRIQKDIMTALLRKRINKRVAEDIHNTIQQAIGEGKL